MHRRNFLSVSAAAGLVSGAAAAPSPAPNHLFELRSYQLRNSKADQRRRLVGFLENHHLPMSKRLEIGPVGYFQLDFGAGMPQIITVTSYDSWAAVGEKRAAQSADEQWSKAVKQFGSADEPAYDRVESSLLWAFDGMPKIEVPDIQADKAPRLFDLRTYEAETAFDTSEKIRMFNEGEIEIFRRSGIHPVFFGQTVIGSRMPNLTYMVWYDDWEARQQAWDKFLADPEWKRISVKPGWTNAEVVSSITHRFLRPLPFSPIR